MNRTAWCRYNRNNTCTVQLWLRVLCWPATGLPPPALPQVAGWGVCWLCSCSWCTAATPRAGPTPGRWRPGRRTRWARTSGSRRARRCTRPQRSPHTRQHSHLTTHSNNYSPFTPFNSQRDACYICFVNRTPLGQWYPTLKVQCHNIFGLLFSPQSNPPGPLIKRLKWFCIKKFRGDIHELKNSALYSIIQRGVDWTPSRLTQCRLLPAYNLSLLGRTLFLKKCGTKKDSIR